jgi:hypothetical protein
MHELGLVALLLGVLIAVPWALAVAPWELTLTCGTVLVALGLLVGVPASAVYHLLLSRALKPGRLWWLHPTALHGQLDGAARPRVLRWFRVGAAAFGVAILGCALAAVGAVRGR